MSGRNIKVLLRKKEAKKAGVLSVLIFPEGARTEREYFYATKPKTSRVRVRCICRGHKSSPRNILRSVEIAMRDLDPNTRFEIWIVIDRDSWHPADLDMLVGARFFSGGGLTRARFFLTNPRAWPTEG